MKEITAIIQPYTLSHIVDALHARTGNKGDSLSTIKDVARVIRIRTEETAGQAL